MGPKNENVDFPLVFVPFLDWSRGGTASKIGPIWAASLPKLGILLKMLSGYIQNCASYCSGEHILRKIMKQGGQKVKNGAGKP